MTISPKLLNIFEGVVFGSGGGDGDCTDNGDLNDTFWPIPIPLNCPGGNIPLPPVIGCVAAGFSPPSGRFRDQMSLQLVHVTYGPVLCTMMSGRV